MAKIWALPEGFEPPDFGEYISAPGGFAPGGPWDQACKAFEDALAAEAKSHNTGDLVGRVIRFPVADGQASYMVWKQKPLELVYVPLVDNYQIPEAHARGLRVADVRKMVSFEDAWAKMASK